MAEDGKPLGRGDVSSGVLDVIEQHRVAFEALQKQVELTDPDDGDEIDLAEDVELERFENVVQEAAVAMTTMPLRSVDDVVALLAYIDEFSRGRKSGYLLWPEMASVGGEQLPWPFAILRRVGRYLESIGRIVER